MEQNFERKRILGINYKVKYKNFEKLDWIIFIVNLFINIIILDMAIIFIGIFRLDFGIFNIIFYIMYSIIIWFGFANILYYIYNKNINVDKENTFKGFSSIAISIFILALLVILINFKVI